jgi:hypothetical protein
MGPRGGAAHVALIAPEEAAAVGADLVGDKAVELFALDAVLRHARLSSIPRFVVVPTQLTREWRRSIWGERMPVDFPPRPDPEALPDGVCDHFVAFGERAARTLAQAGRRVGRERVVRTSLVARLPPSASGAGVNSTWVDEAAEPPRRYAVRLIERLHRAYTYWYLSGWSSPAAAAPRDCGFIVMERTPFVATGTAYGTPDRLVAEWRSVPGDRVTRIVIDRTDEGRTSFEMHPSRVPVSTLWTCCRVVGEGLDFGPEASFELEFLLARDRIHLIQARRLPDAQPGVFHTVGAIVGPLISALDVGAEPSDPLPALTEALRRGPPILAVPFVDTARVDAFFTAWQLTQGAWARFPRPAAIVVVHDQASMLRYGFRNHLVRAMREVLPNVAVAQVTEDEWTRLSGRLSGPGQGGSLRLTSDGVACSLETGGA